VRASVRPGVLSQTRVAAGHYRVVFDRNVAACGVTATAEHPTPLVVVTSVPGATVDVRVFDLAGQLTAPRFLHVAAVCAPASSGSSAVGGGESARGEEDPEEVQG
jgi:hypothetical protein